MPQSASVTTAQSPAIAVLRHPVTAITVVSLIALIWASVGFASSLFTNDIVVADGSYGFIRSSIAGPAALILLGIGYLLGRGLRPRHDAAH